MTPTSLSRVIAEAFHPLAVSQWLVSDPDARREIFPGYFRILVEHALDTGTVLTTPGRTAVALWLPVGTDGPQPPPATRHDWPPRPAPGTAGSPHWTPRSTGTAPSARRTTIWRSWPSSPASRASASVPRCWTPITQDLDTARRAAYLEASGPDTRRIYLVHGYADHGPPIRLPDGPVMYPMLRQPQAPRR